MTIDWDKADKIKLHDKGVDAAINGASQVAHAGLDEQSQLIYAIKCYLQWMKENDSDADTIISYDRAIDSGKLFKLVTGKKDRRT